MNFTETQVVERIESLTVTRLRRWVQSGWVKTTRSVEASGEVRFTDTDIARLQMICDLFDICDFDEEALPVLLSLIDRVHGLRGELRALLRAIEAQPDSVREEIKRAYLRIVAE